MSRYFRVDEELAPGVEIALDPQRFERVLRVRVGDRLTLCSPSGRLFEVEVTIARPPVARVVAEGHGLERNPRRSLEVWVPMLKGGRTDDLVRQLTELGATRIVPFSSSHAVVRLEPSKAEERRRRFAQIAEEAGNQCGRTLLPEVLAPVDGLPSVGGGLFLWEGYAESGGDMTLREALSDDALSARILAGPEGGLSEREAAHLVSLGWRGVGLGPRILRAETAVIMLATLALERRGEFETHR